MIANEQMKIFLVKKKITQRYLAKKSGMHYTRLNSFLNGWLKLHERDIKKLCKVLKIEFNDFMQGKIKEITGNK